MDFDQLAARYDAWYHTPLGALAHALESEAILRLTRVASGERVLDLGCGTGLYALELSRRGAWVVGLDPSFEMLTVAREKFRRAGHPARFVCASAEALPFRTGTFDLVAAVTSLCFVQGPDRAIQEAHRALRPDGRLVIGELNRSSIWGFWRRLKGMFRDTIYNQAHFWSLRELTQLLQRNGFVVQTASTLLHFPPIPYAALVKRYPLVESWAARARSGWGAFIAMSAQWKEE
jgi:ubiquinone/menaquinone biosynthesis C-methylase UbiE